MKTVVVLVAIAAVASMTMSLNVAASRDDREVAERQVAFMGVRLTVAPSAALVDSPVVFRVAGLRPSSQVILSASTLDARGRSWLSQALFRADAAGVVDVRSSRALGGSYVGRHAQGLLWSMLPVRKGADGSGLFEPRAKSTVSVDVQQNARLLATAHLVWRGKADRVRETPMTLADAGFVGVYDTPTVHRARLPAVLILGGSEGGNSGVPLARLLASHGYPALSIAYFGAPGLPAELNRIPLEYFEGALRWLASRPGVDPERLTILGASRGGEAALLVGSTYPSLVHPVIAYTPSATVAGSCCSTFTDPAWTLDGKPIPFGLNSPITVERIRGPVLAIGAALDQVWPSYIAAKSIELRARQHGKQNVTGIVYAGAGHAVGAVIPNLPVPLVTKVGGRTIDFGGSIPDDAQARDNAWRRVLALLDKTTRAPRPGPAERRTLRVRETCARLQSDVVRPNRDAGQPTPTRVSQSSSDRGR